MLDRAKGITNSWGEGPRFPAFDICVSRGQCDEFAKGMFQDLVWIQYYYSQSQFIYLYHNNHILCPITIIKDVDLSRHSFVLILERGEYDACQCPLFVDPIDGECPPRTQL